MEITTNKNRISKYFRLPAMNQTERQEDYKEEDKHWKGVLPVHNDQYIFGIEVEVERAAGFKSFCYSKQYWEPTTDHSLRNDGYEFVSVPLRSTQIEPALMQLERWLPTTVEFSPRTSVHVHMNVRDLTIEQIANLIFIYTTVEDVLFNWVGHNRDQNVFCIKVTETDYVRNFLTFCANPSTLAQHVWNKYTAFNLVPIQSKGTVEFRHLYGTMDKEIIITWINFLSALKTQAKNTTLSQTIALVRELNTSSQYELYLESIFKEYTTKLNLHPRDMQPLMEHAISYVKLAIVAMEDQVQEQAYVGIDWAEPPPARPRATLRPAPTARVNTTGFTAYAPLFPDQPVPAPPTLAQEEEAIAQRILTDQEMELTQRRMREQMEFDAWIRGNVTDVLRGAA